jgi:hypothetical protein
MAGILAHARGMIAVLAPTVNSYKRLVPGYEAPTYLTWGRTNRSALIRVPMVSPGRSIEGTRVEVRCPDPSSNTYLAFSAMIAAGLDGVERGLELSDPVEESLFEMDSARIAEKGIKELPGTLGDAITELEKDSVIREALATTFPPLEAKRSNGTSTARRSRPEVAAPDMCSNPVPRRIRSASSPFPAIPRRRGPSAAPEAIRRPPDLFPVLSAGGARARSAAVQARADGARPHRALAQTRPRTPAATRAGRIWPTTPVHARLTVAWFHPRPLRDIRC